MWSWWTKLSELAESFTPYVLVTLIQNEGSSPRETQAKMIVVKDQVFGTIGGGQFEWLAIEESKKLLGKQATKTESYALGASAGQCCGGKVTILFEAAGLRPRLSLFGAGHVGQAVVGVLMGTPFLIHVIDEREEQLQNISENSQVKVFKSYWEDYCEETQFDQTRDYAVVMTHSHQLDKDIMLGLFQKELKYLGLIGSQQKWQNFQNHFRARGIEESIFSDVHCPLGLSTGGKAPKEVAISLSAQLLQYHYKREKVLDEKPMAGHIAGGREILQDGQSQGIITS